MIRLVFRQIIYYIHIIRSIIVVIILSGSILGLAHAQQSPEPDHQPAVQHFLDASSNNFPPMNFLSKDGDLTGFGQELSEAVIKSIGGDVTHIHSSSWVEVLEWLDTGKADFIHDTGYTKDRDDYLDYTDPIIEMPEVIFVQNNQYNITNFSDLYGKTVACVDNHITHLYLQQFSEINCYVVETPVQGIYELVAGKVDAFVYPQQIVMYLIQQLRLDDKIKITGDPLRTLTWSMVVKEGNSEVLEILNEGIAKIRQSGEYDLIYNRWWGKSILAGYSKRELRIIVVITTGASILIVLSMAILLVNWRLRNSKYVLETEIVERRRVEEKLNSSLKEKEVLLRELYHRTKNNMEVIRSMLVLQSANTRNKLANNVFKEIETKIQTMALVHQKLYQSQDLSKINLHDYFEELSNLLVESYNVSSNKISVILNIDNIFVLIDTAIPIGLVLNELMSNSLKHAFPEEMKGEISIRLFRTDQGDIELHFSDNGVGVPEGFSFSTQETLGLKTMFALVEHQLQGEIHFEVQNGIKSFIRFSDTLYTERV